MKIRTAELLDEKEIDSLCLELHRIHLEERPNEFTKRRKFFYSGVFSSMIKNEDCIILVAENEFDEIVGVLVGAIRGKVSSKKKSNSIYFYVENLIVKDEYRSQGIGTQLMEELKTRVKGVNRIELNVWAFNSEAINFYKSLGYNVKMQRMELNLNNQR